MIWYVAVIAMVNLGLGYALGIRLGRRSRGTWDTDEATEAAALTEY